MLTKTRNRFNAPTTADDLVAVEPMQLVLMGPLGRKLRELYRCSRCGATLESRWWVALFRDLLPKRFCEKCGDELHRPH